MTGTDVADVLVIGAGVIGCSIVLVLAQRGEALSETMYARPH